MSDWLLVIALTWPWLAVACSVLATVTHAADEVFGDGGPLWSELGRVAGAKVPDWAGSLGVAVVLPAALIAAALGGYVFRSEAALSLLAGAKLGDALFSHFSLWISGLSRPNPGLPSSILYVVEGLAVICVLPVSPAIAAGAALCFAAVIPSLWIAACLGLIPHGADAETRP